jgi:hypothetical protein
MPRGADVADDVTACNHFDLQPRYIAAHIPDTLQPKYIAAQSPDTLQPNTTAITEITKSTYRPKSPYI